MDLTAELQLPPWVIWLKTQRCHLQYKFQRAKHKVLSMLACQSKTMLNTGNSRHKRTLMKLVQNSMKEFFLYHSPGLKISSLHTDSMILKTNKNQLERKRKLFYQRTNATLQSATMFQLICMIKQHSFQRNRIR